MISGVASSDAESAEFPLLSVAEEAFFVGLVSLEV